MNRTKSKCSRILNYSWIWGKEGRLSREASKCCLLASVWQGQCNNFNSSQRELPQLSHNLQRRSFHLVRCHLGCSPGVQTIFLRTIVWPIAIISSTSTSLSQCRHLVTKKIFIIVWNCSQQIQMPSNSFKLTKSNSGTHSLSSWKLQKSQKILKNSVTYKISSHSHQQV